MTTRLGAPAPRTPSASFNRFVARWLTSSSGSSASGIGLSRELHGNLQQLIVLAKMRLSRLSLTTHEELKPVTDAVDEVLSKAVAESRAFSNLLSPPLIHDAGLVPALRWMVRTEAESGGVELEAELADDVAIVDLDRRVAVFAQIRALVAQARAVGAQSAALNARRTSANEVRLTLRVSPRTVRTNTLASGRRRWISRMAAIPPASGNTRSKRTTSGSVVSSKPYVSFVVLASPTTDTSSTADSMARTPSRKTG